MMPILVTGVAFGQDQIQINFMEQKHQTSNGSLDQTLVLTLSDKDAQLVAEIQEALVEIIDGYWVSLRRPEAEEEPRRNRFLESEED